MERKEIVELIISITFVAGMYLWGAMKNVAALLTISSALLFLLYVIYFNHVGLIPFAVIFLLTQILLSIHRGSHNG